MQEVRCVVDNDLEVETQTYDIYLNNPRTTPKQELETVVMVKIV